MGTIAKGLVRRMIAATKGEGFLPRQVDGLSRVIDDFGRSVDEKWAIGPTGNCDFRHFFLVFWRSAQDPRHVAHGPTSAFSRTRSVPAMQTSHTSHTVSPASDIVGRNDTLRGRGTAIDPLSFALSKSSASR